MQASTQRKRLQGRIAKAKAARKADYLVTVTPKVAHFSAGPFCMVIAASNEQEAEQLAQANLTRNGTPADGYFFDAYLN